MSNSEVNQCTCSNQTDACTCGFRPTHNFNYDFYIKCKDCFQEFGINYPQQANILPKVSSKEEYFLISVPKYCPSCHNIRLIK